MLSLGLNAVSQNRFADVSYFQMPNHVLENAAMERVKSELKIEWDHFIFLLPIKTSSTNNMLLIRRVAVDMCYRGNFISIEGGCYEASRLIPCYKCIWLNFLKLKGILN